MNIAKMFKIVELITLVLSVLCLQSSGCASRSAPAKRGEVAGHAQPLGQVDDQEIQ